MVYFPPRLNRFSASFARVDFPDPESPVNHRVKGFCPILSARISLVRSNFCHTIFSDLLNECSTTPQAEVILVTRSISMKLPMLLCFSKVSNTTGDEAATSQTAISFLYNFEVAICSPVLTSIRYLISMTDTGSIWVPILIRKFFPCLNSMSSIQSIFAVNMLLTINSVSFANTQPLEISTSLLSETVTA